MNIEVGQYYKIKDLSPSEIFVIQEVFLNEDLSKNYGVMFMPYDGEGESYSTRLLEYSIIHQCDLMTSEELMWYILGKK